MLQSKKMPAGSITNKLIGLSRKPREKKKKENRQSRPITTYFNVEKNFFFF